jgi:hypothetical protein
MYRINSGKRVRKHDPMIEPQVFPNPPITIIHRMATETIIENDSELIKLE